MNSRRSRRIAQEPNLTTDKYVRSVKHMIEWTPTLSLAGALFGTGLFSIVAMALLGGLELGTDGKPPTIGQIAGWLAVLGIVSLLVSMLIFGVIEAWILHGQATADADYL
jgi:cbb3-type cytochrome oxidase subunit 1